MSYTLYVLSESDNGQGKEAENVLKFTGQQYNVVNVRAGELMTIDQHLKVNQLPAIIEFCPCCEQYVATYQGISEIRQYRKDIKSNLRYQLYFMSGFSRNDEARDLLQKHQINFKEFDVEAEGMLDWFGDEGINLLPSISVIDSDGKTVAEHEGINAIRKLFL